MSTASNVENQTIPKETNKNLSKETEKNTEVRPSFMKSVFSGCLDEKLLFPFPKPKAEEIEEIESFTKEVNKFCEENIDANKIDQDEKMPTELIEALKEMGFLALTAPEEYDGLGVSNTFFSKFMGTICCHCASVGTTLGAHLSIGSKGLFIFGTEEQKQKYIPRLTNEWLAAFCLTEPQAGSDAGSIRTTAKLSEDGKHYILNGEKIYITNGGIADFFTVFAKIVSNDEEEKGFTAFIVTRDMGGISNGKEEKKLGLKASSTTPVIFTDVKIPVENVLGETGKGFKVAMEILNLGRLGLAASCAGAMPMLIELSTKYANQRKQFGYSLSEFGLIQKKLARMGIFAFAMESSVYLTAALADRKDVDFSIESAICKIFTTECIWEAVNETVQVFGGNGFIADFGIERSLRDSRVNMIFEGTNEILRLFIAITGMRDVGKYLQSVGKALNHPLQSFGILCEYFSARVVRSFAKERIENVSSQLVSETRVIEKYVELLSQSVEKSIKTYKKDIINQQFVLERFANMAIYIYTLVACVSRVDTSLKAGIAEEELQYELSCLRAYSFIAEKQLEDNYSAFTNNYDEEIQAISQHLCKKEGYPSKLWQ